MKLSKVDQDLITLLQDLIKIPSWIPDDPEQSINQNENQLVDYLETAFKKNTDFEIERQPLQYGRFNLILKKGKPDLVFLAHTDTVAPSSNAKYDQLSGKIQNERIWGRGACDMKSGIAAMTQAIFLNPNANNIWFFLYADEEYNFLGMREIVKKYSNIKPKLIVSSDGSDLKIGHGCRGLIEFRGRFVGQNGHPARGTGNSAIEKGFHVLDLLKQHILKEKHPIMGISSFNIAHVIGGTKKEDSLNDQGYLTSVGQAGNVVPDIFEFVLDIRPSSTKIKYENIIEFIKTEALKLGISFEIIKKTHDYGSWFTDLSKIQKYINGKIENPNENGYLDLQMFWDTVGQPPALMFGGGEGNTAHTANENIKIENLIKERDFFKKLISNF